MEVDIILKFSNNLKPRNTLELILKAKASAKWAYIDKANL